MEGGPRRAGLTYRIVWLPIGSRGCNCAAMEQFESIVDGSGPLAIAIKAALADASESKGKLDPDALSIRGMSGKKFRYFLNNLIETVSNPRYLEIGCWQGSTLCSALHKNALTALAI